jgi:hypothetical protein
MCKNNLIPPVDHPDRLGLSDKALNAVQRLQTKPWGVDKFDTFNSDWV